MQDKGHEATNHSWDELQKFHHRTDSDACLQGTYDYIVEFLCYYIESKLSVIYYPGKTGNDITP